MALSFAYFLDTDNWEQYGFVNTNVDPKKLNPIIQRVQRTRLEPILGTALYDKLVSLNPNPTGLYKTLMDKHIIMFLVAYCDWKYTFHGTDQLTNKTSGKFNDAEQRANSTEENNNLRDELLKDAKQIERKMIGWLCDNKADIPELNDVDPLTLHESLRPQVGFESNFGNGFGVLPKRRHK